MPCIAICDQCKKEFSSFPCYERRVRKNRFCSKKCESEYKNLNNTRDNWTGGTIGKSTGYKYIRIDGKQIGEHILVAEKKIGRRLLKGEVVHHINGDKLDNRPENLLVVTKSEHSKIHNEAKGNTFVCRRCGVEKEHHGRGLCHTCYHYELMHKNLHKYSRINNFAGK